MAGSRNGRKDPPKRQVDRLVIRPRPPYLLVTVSHDGPKFTAMERPASLGDAARAMMTRPEQLAAAMAGQRVVLSDVRSVADALDRLLGDRGWVALRGGERSTVLLIRTLEV